MRRSLLQILACPECIGDLQLTEELASADAFVREGTLKCVACRKTYRIVRGIPRFVPAEGYADSFGLQWNKFRRVQLDSENGAALSRHRFFSETGTTAENLKGLRVLEAGCGAGRFL